jgi:hypothetical protein
MAVSPSAERMVAASLADAVSMAAAMAIPRAPASEAVDQAAASQTIEQQPNQEAAPFRTAEMEQDLLAGIEEFRNQLAQLKSQTFDVAGLGQAG